MAGESLLVSFVKVAAGVAVVFPLLVYFLQERLIFYPQSLGEARRVELLKRHPAATEVTLQSPDGVRLHAWHVRAAPGAPLVLYFGGNAEEVSWMLESIGDPSRGETPGAAWLLIDYRGYGLSEGSPSERALVADALAFYDHAVKLTGVDARRVVAFGRSLGSGVAVALAAARPLAGVVLVAPYDSVLALAKRYYPFLPVEWMLKHRFDSIGHAPSLRTPLLAIIAERDEVIPPQHGERLYAAWGGEKTKVLLAGATHNDTDRRPAFWASIRGFVDTR